MFTKYSCLKHCRFSLWRVVTSTVVLCIYVYVVLLVYDMNNQATLKKIPPMSLNPFKRTCIFELVICERRSLLCQEVWILNHPPFFLPHTMTKYSVWLPVLHIMAVLTFASCIMVLGTGYLYRLGVTENCDAHISGAAISY